jgi:hypothetical protein
MMQVIIFDKNHVMQPHAMIFCAAASHGIFLQKDASPAAFFEYPEFYFCSCDFIHKLGVMVATPESRCRS